MAKLVSLPRAALNDRGDCSTRSTKLSRYSCRRATASALRTNPCGALIVQDCARDAGPPLLPTLTDLVGDILELSPEKQVARVTTRRIVALVQYARGLRDRTNSNGPSHSVRRLVADSRKADPPISVAVTRSQPVPAMSKLRPVLGDGRGLIDAFPKVRNVGFVDGSRNQSGAAVLLIRARADATRRNQRVCSLVVVKKLLCCWFRGGALGANLVAGGRNGRGTRWAQCANRGPSSGLASRVTGIASARSLRPLAPTLATQLRARYDRIVHWVTSSEPVPGCFNTPGTLAWSVT